MTVQLHFAVGIDFDGDVLAEPHTVELSLLEVGYHPRDRRDHVENLLAGLRVRARIDVAACDAALLGRTDFGVGQVQLRLRQTGFSLLHLRLALLHRA